VEPDLTPRSLEWLNNIFADRLEPRRVMGVLANDLLESQFDRMVLVLDDFHWLEI
jgi:hypothetical protein